MTESWANPITMQKQAAQLAALAVETAITCWEVEQLAQQIGEDFIAETTHDPLLVGLFTYEFDHAMEQHGGGAS